MITVLVGENSFEIERSLSEIEAGFDGEPEKIDGTELQLSQLPDLLMGVSLFGIKRLLVIRNLSKNKSIWPVFGNWIDKVSSDIELILIDLKLDKRTSTFKALKDEVKINYFYLFSDRDFNIVLDWLLLEAKKLGLALDKKSAQFLIDMVGFDQWQLSSALTKLLLIGDTSIDTIKDVIEPSPVTNVFILIEMAIGGDVVALKQNLANLEKTENPYKLFALLSSQIFQLLVASVSEKNDNFAKDFSIQPFAVSKLAILAKKIGNKKLLKMVNVFAKADDDMKISKAEPWLLIEKALLKISLI